MKKFFLITIAVIGLAASFLYYDWYSKHKQAASNPTQTFYHWVDENGVRHYNEKKPQNQKKIVKTITMPKPVDPPYVELILKKGNQAYEWLQKKISGYFKPQAKKKS